MKKCNFYTRKCINHKQYAVLVSGYTDGIYNYYKTDGGFWWAIQPETGLSISGRATRRDAAEEAHNLVQRTTDYVNSRSGKATIEVFSKMIQEAKENEQL